MIEATTCRTRRQSGPLIVVGLAMLTVLGSLADGTAAERRRPRRHVPPAQPYTDQLPYGSQGYAPGPDFGGFQINQFGYGNYTRGPDGGIGGYPPGTAGAVILQQRQDRKCKYLPESC